MVVRFDSDSGTSFVESALIDTGYITGEYVRPVGFQNYINEQYVAYARAYLGGIGTDISKIWIESKIITKWIYTSLPTVKLGVILSGVVPMGFYGWSGSISVQWCIVKV